MNTDLSAIFIISNFTNSAIAAYHLEQLKVKIRE